MLGSLSIRSRPVLVLVLILGLFALVSLFLGVSTDGYVVGSQSTGSGVSKFWHGPAAVTNGHIAIPVDSLEGYIEAYLDEHSRVIATHYLEEQGLKLNHTSYSDYISGLEDAYTEFFSRPTAPEWLDLVGARSSLVPPSRPLPPSPKQVITTDESLDHLPAEFSRWREVMPDWDLRYFDDEGLIDWVKENFGGTQAEKTWKALPRRVLQTDIFRYMIMLVEGGIYTDRPAAPIIHADNWGKPYANITPKPLCLLSKLSTLASVPSKADHIANGKAAYHSDINESPSLILSIEADALKFGWSDWRERGMARAVQITQWTFLARPGHPIFLDVLGRALRQAQEIAALAVQAKERQEDFVPPSALEWTGPGVFSDAVYAYLLARYAVKPEALSGHSEPFRVGDILFLPAGSFSSVDPGQEQRPWAAVWHGFFGRWRGTDPAEVEVGKANPEAEGAEDHPTVTLAV